jgi:hypothetical protein
MLDAGGVFEDVNAFGQVMQMLQVRCLVLTLEGSRGCYT